MRHPIENLNTEDRREKILEVVKTILASGPNVEVRYAPGTSLRPLPEGFTEICIIAKEGGFVASAIKLAQALNDAPKLAQLEAQLQVDKTRVLPKVGMSKAQRDRYLETVPDGKHFNNLIRLDNLSLFKVMMNKSGNKQFVKTRLQTSIFQYQFVDGKS